MSVHPIAIELAGDDRLRIVWSDQRRREYTFRQLRENCPCATCREKKKQPPPPATMLTVLSPEEARPLKVQGMKPMGNYAYTIAFSDGHDTGIFTFELLRQLGEEVL